jgi:hypothetical protein
MILATVCRLITLLEDNGMKLPLEMEESSINPSSHLAPVESPAPTLVPPIVPAPRTLTLISTPAPPSILTHRGPILIPSPILTSPSSYECWYVIICGTEVGVFQSWYIHFMVCWDYIPISFLCLGLEPPL